MAITIGYVSEKGGVGKTTTCYHVAIALKRYEGKRVLVVDTDYQRGGLTCRFLPAMIEDFRQGRSPTATTLFDKFQQLYSGSAVTPEVDILETPAGVNLMPADPRLAQVSVDKMPATNNIRENNQLLWRHLSLIAFVLTPIRTQYDFVLIDSHPELSDLLRSVVYACGYCVSPVKLDLQSTIGVPSAIQAINEVNSDMEMIARATGEDHGFIATKFSGAIGMMAREWGGILKSSERIEYRRLERTCGVFSNYVTEGDGIRQAAANRCPVYDISGVNADRQSTQFRSITTETITRCPG
jgi:chromosome partitioning protein